MLSFAQPLDTGPNSTAGTDSDACPEAVARLLHNWTFLVRLALILVLATTLYTTVAICWPKFSRAEVFFAECAREMLATSNYVTPLYHGQPFFDKPILVYWLILANFKLLGASHLTARIPSILAGVATVATTGILTGAAAGTIAGLLAAMALASSFMFISFSALCMSDMLLTCCDTVTLALLYAGTLSDKQRMLLWWLAAACMGMAFLTKGPVGLVLPLLSFVIYLAITRQLSLVKPVHLLLGGITAAIIASPWFLAAYRANGAGALQYFVLHENVQRFIGSTYDTHRPPWFMLTALFAGFAPWSIFLPFVLAGSITKWREAFSSKPARRDLFVWLWIATITLFFSLSRGKIDYYALPAYPAAAALTGIYLSQWISTRSRGAAAGAWILAMCLAAAAICSSFFLSKLSGGATPLQWILMPAALTTSALLMALCMYHKAYFKAYTLVYIAVSLAAIGFCLQILPVLLNLQPVLNYISTVRNSPPATRIGIYRTVDSWIDETTFQTGREPVKLSNTAELTAFLNSKPAALLVVPKDKFEELPASVLAKVRILDSRPYIEHSLNPGFALKRNGVLTANQPLLLVGTYE